MSDLKIAAVDKSQKIEFIGLSEQDKIKLHKAATEFEAIMLKELLKSTVSKETRGMFGGGMAEEFFADHLNNERAQAMAKSGGLGVGQMIETEILQSYKSRVKLSAESTDKVNEATTQLKKVEEGITRLKAKATYGKVD